VNISLQHVQAHVDIEPCYKLFLFFLFVVFLFLFFYFFVSMSLNDGVDAGRYLVDGHLGCDDISIILSSMYILYI